MRDGTWLKVGDNKFCNLAAITFIEEAEDATTLYGGPPGSGAHSVRVTDTNARKQIHSFVDQSAAAGSSRY